jgi:hypothetical protein
MLKVNAAANDNLDLSFSPSPHLVLTSVNCTKHSEWATKTLDFLKLGLHQGSEVRRLLFVRTWFGDSNYFGDIYVDLFRFWLHLDVSIAWSRSSAATTMVQQIPFHQILHPSNLTKKLWN